MISDKFHKMQKTIQVHLYMTLFNNRGTLEHKLASQSTDMCLLYICENVYVAFKQIPYFPSEVAIQFDENLNFHIEGDHSYLFMI